MRETCRHRSRQFDRFSLLPQPSQKDSVALAQPTIAAFCSAVFECELGVGDAHREVLHGAEGLPRGGELGQHGVKAVVAGEGDVVVLLVPGMNPDGLDITRSWWLRTRGTPYAGSEMPWLYHHYVGHDNNRDFFMVTQPETRAVTRVLYEQWFPEVVYDVHQMGNRGARFFVPPFADPLNPNLDPLLLLRHRKSLTVECEPASDGDQIRWRSLDEPSAIRRLPPAPVPVQAPLPAPAPVPAPVSSAPPVPLKPVETAAPVANR